MLPRIALTAFAATALVSTPAVAAAPAFTLEMTGYVPTICLTQIEAVPSAGAVLAGTMHEFCNNAAGYEIYAEHSPELAGAVLVVDGAAVALSADGPTRISRSDHADIAARSLELRLPDGRTVAGATLSFRTVAL